MAANITSNDLQAFKRELLSEIRVLFERGKFGSRKRWLKTNDVTQHLELSTSTLQTLRRNGTLPFSRIGATIFYDADDIDRMLEKRKQVKTDLIQSKKSGAIKSTGKGKSVRMVPMQSPPLAA
jgi:hypothetical protein